MKSAFYYTILFFIFSSCNSDASVSETNSDTSQTTLTDTVNVLDIVQEDGPAGWVLAERFASDDNEYIFCEDGTLHFDNHFGLMMQGSWMMKNDTIYLDYTKEITHKGIGEPLPPPPVMPGNYETQYEEYEEIIKQVKESQTLCWSEIKNLLDQDSTYPYEVVSRAHICE
ncbi:MAG: hypothetical protein IPM77_10455 [Crocinitomicaceae bacterium]|nr:hypothetical protein [Crocinitomicaceae bacterium]